MAKYASKFVALFQSWVGLKESDGSHKKIIDIYNSQAVLPRGYKLTYKDPWCAGTVSAGSVHLGYTDIIPTECSCTRMIELFKKLGSWVESDAYIPKPGDIIFYDWDDSGKGENTNQPDHVGVVEKLSGSNIIVIEGNKNNAVERRTLAINGKYIRGYGVPKYDAEPAAEEKKPTATSAAATAITLEAGRSITLKNEPLYATAFTTKKAGSVYGTYYLWSDKATNGRVMITNEKSRVGIKGQVTGWVDVPQLVYKVVSGDTLSKIAKKYGTTAKKIYDVNKRKYPAMTMNFILVGWELTIPK